MCNGSWPPSKAADTFLRAPVPLVPRPAVLPLEASPRPTRVLAVLAPGAGRRWWTLIVTCSSLLPRGIHRFHRQQVGGRLDVSAVHGVVLDDDAVMNAFQAERAHGLARRPLVADG